MITLSSIGTNFVKDKICLKEELGCVVGQGETESSDIRPSYRAPLMYLFYLNNVGVLTVCTCVEEGRE